MTELDPLKDAWPPISTNEAEINTGNQSELYALKKCDMWAAFRKFKNEEIIEIASALYSKGPSTLANLRAETKLDTVALNRRLREMREADLVVKQGRDYYLTKFGAVLFEATKNLSRALKSIDKEKILSPHQEGRT